MRTVGDLLDAGVPIDEEKNGWTALQIAAQEGQLEVAKLLLDRGAELDRESRSVSDAFRGRTPLMDAATVRDFLTILLTRLTKMATSSAIRTWSSCFLRAERMCTSATQRGAQLSLCSEKCVAA